MPYLKTTKYLKITKEHIIYIYIYKRTTDKNINRIVVMWMIVCETQGLDCETDRDLTATSRVTSP